MIILLYLEGYNNIYLLEYVINMMPKFMLPSTGSVTLDGSIVIGIGVVAIIVYLYKNRENISFINENTVVNEENNLLTNLITNEEKNEERKSVDDNELNDIAYEKMEETIKI